MCELDHFDAPKKPQITSFTTDELTALCPFDFGGPDFYTLTLRYEADECVIESKSLKMYLEGYRDTEISAEALACQIYGDVCDTIDPVRCYIRLEQARRGGVEETVEMGDHDLRE